MSRISRSSTRAYGYGLATVLLAAVVAVPAVPAQQNASRASRTQISIPVDRYQLSNGLTVYGGKITTYRRLAELALKRLRPYFRLGAPWTADAPLPGGDFPHDGVEALMAATWFAS